MREGAIRPALEAGLREYDPWAGFWDRGSGRVSQPPHVQLVNLARRLPSPYPEGRSLELTDGEERDLLRWCARYGLLGIVSDPSLEPDGGWRSFFPGVPSDRLERYLSWEPLSEGFWRHYVEPVADFAWQAKRFADAVTRLSARNLGDFTDTLYDHVIVDETSALHTLNEMAATVSPQLVREPGRRFQQAWESRSLLGALAMMVMQDLTGEIRLYRCPCGRVISSSYPDTKYCGPKHRVRYRKQAQRARERHLREGLQR